jgi:hypothetical protein
MAKTEKIHFILEQVRQTLLLTSYCYRQQQMST